MERAIKNILQAALASGACRLAEKPTDTKSLVGLFFSPQGKEFCQDKAFPTLPMFRRLNAETNIADYGVYVDSDDISAYCKENIALVGKTRGALSYDGVDCRYSIILMHGAEATIKARNNAVIEVVQIGGCKVDYDVDETVVLL